MNNVLFSKKSDHWRTPEKAYNYFIVNGFVDPYPLGEDYDKPLYMWYNSKIFINPPYNKMEKWADYIVELSKNNNYIVVLVPARTDTRWFHKLLKCRPIIYFVKGRLRFSEKGSAPFPSLYLIFDNQKGGGTWQHSEK